MRLIDADALMKWLNDTYCDTSKRLWNYNHHVMAMDMIEIIENYPTIEERKHGHWIELNPHDEQNNFIQCSVCGSKFGLYSQGNYCQECGTKMDEEVQK